MLPPPSGPPALGLGCGSRLTPLHQGEWLEAADAGERLLYKIKRAALPGHMDGTPTPPPPAREAHPGAALHPLLQPEGDPAPSQPPAGQGRLEPCPHRGGSEAEPHRPGPPHAPSPSPPSVPPTADSDTGQLNTTADTGGGGGRPQAGLEDRALLPWLLHGGRAQHCPDGLVEHRLQAALRQGRALQVLD